MERIVKDKCRFDRTGNQRMKSCFKLVLPILIIIFLVWTVLRSWSSLEEKLISANFLYLFLSLGILVGAQVGAAYLWYRLLPPNKISFRESFRIFVFSNFGRFIPGVVLHYVARVYLTKKKGIDVKEVVLSVFLEAYYSLLGSAIVSLLAISYIKKYLPFSQFIIIIFIVAILFVFFLSPVRIFSIARKIPFIKHKIPIFEVPLSYKTHIVLTIWTAFLFLLNGISFYLISRAFEYVPISNLSVFTGLFSASWIIGFLTPVAPGGLGVTDLSFAYLLLPFFNFSEASFLSLLFRFGFMMSEGVVFLFVWLFYRKKEVGKLVRQFD